MKFTKEEMSNALDEAYKKAGDNAYFANGFALGVEFALQQVKSVDLADVVNCSSCKYQMYGTTEPCRSCIWFSNHTPK
jgi:myo-inositol-hexaphosphate 3-phosphohydrolase